MIPDKQIKADFRKTAWDDPDKYYATSVLKEEGFIRKICTKCSKPFWAIKDSKVCGDPACSGGFRFFEGSPAKNRMDYIEAWQRFAELFRKFGYTPIKRYPVVARWRDDTDFVQASIYDFQPYVVNGTIDPPANPLVVPQFCLRFNDIDNVGITGAHYTGFVMIGQHAFMPPENWNQDQYFRDIHTWLKEGLGLPNEEIIFHEDAWAGGGNFGPCMEFFSRGLELGNQVYMMYQQTPGGNKELNLKVLDMGMGHERNAWFTKATSTSYETTFPTVTKFLHKETGIKIDDSIMKKFLPYASYLNVDEVENIDKAWDEVSKKTCISKSSLKQSIIPLSQLYSVAEHSRSLLFAISDGALPSNVGGGYNLRVILRRALQFIEKNRWNIRLPELCRLHASYLRPIFPELSENLDDVEQILDVEEKKFYQTLEKSRRIVKGIFEREQDIDTKKLIELYDSHGITPDLISDEAESHGKDIEVPDRFYALVAEQHEQTSQAKEKEKVYDLHGVPDTKALYFDDFKICELTSRVIKVIDNIVILDQTIFYPTSGGQDHDIGTMDDIKVIDVKKQGPHILHFLENPSFKEGDKIHSKIDFSRRLQLTQHHSATHLINGAARKILGSHIWQAGAEKRLDKARLDITHYEQISKEDLQKIEELANEMIAANKPVYKSFMKRNLAESKYGFRLYQGGAVPGKEIRVVDYSNFDIEACGGTHVDLTGEIQQIKILRSTKIQDGIVRIEFTAGDAALDTLSESKALVEQLTGILGVDEDLLASHGQELFEKWKRAKKIIKKGSPDPEFNPELVSQEKIEGDPVQNLSGIYKTQPEHIVKTIERFRKELADMADKLPK
ncbi:alanine--tRNA ligase [Candidatus Woesearchaeota archaeon]|nr:alanine--tRNA ligase [Candidatus Woesearchaeota archaeon]